MINIGGGDYFRKHWRVLDFPSNAYPYPLYYIDYVHDLMSNKPFPIADNSVKFFYSAHTLEHIPQENCQYIFNEIYRCLGQNGAVRLSIPDFDKAYKAYGENNRNFFKKYNTKNIEESFLEFFASFLKFRVPIKEFKENYKLMSKEKFADFYIQKIPRKSQKKKAGNHINWWNYNKIKNMLQKAGFKKIYRSYPQGSRFKEMKGIGRKSGFDSTHPELSFFIEAIK
ncbi:MAG: methyltransferase domain-containing protein [Candidatus Hermodarchaeota archaeon]